MSGSGTRRARGRAGVLPPPRRTVVVCDDVPRLVPDEARAGALFRKGIRGQELCLCALSQRLSRKQCADGSHAAMLIRTEAGDASSGPGCRSPAECSRGPE